MLTDRERSKAADILLEAEKTRKPTLQLSKTFPNIEVEDSCAIPRWAPLGSPTRSGSAARCWSPATSCDRARSRGEIGMPGIGLVRPYRRQLGSVAVQFV